MKIIHVNHTPRKGHEFQYHLAWKHRVQAGRLMKWSQRYWWKPSVYNRCFKLWAHAMDRVNKYGEDVVSNG